MLNFLQHMLNEMAAFSSTASSDDKGKLHELLLAKHLSKHLDPKGEGFLPQHFRASQEHPNKKIKGKSPEEVHDDIRRRIGSNAFDEINDHAKQTAEATIAHLIKTGRIKKREDIKNVHWTSNADTDKKAGDHQNLTHIKDVNANGDLILTSKHPTEKGKDDFIPISAKYGSQDKPNFRNDGLDALDAKAGLSNGTLAGHQANMERELQDKLGNRHIGDSQAERHNSFREDRHALEAEKEAHTASEKQRLLDHVAKGGKKKDFVSKEFQPKSKGSKAASQAYGIALEHRRKMAADLAKGFEQTRSETGSDQHMRDYISGQVSPKTIFKHVIVHSHVQDDNKPELKKTDAKSVIMDADKVGPEHVSNYSDIRASHGKEGGEGGGVSVNFYGTHKVSGKRHLIATQSLKGTDGPYKGTNGIFNVTKHESEEGEEPVVKDKNTGKHIPVPENTPKNSTVATIKSSKPNRVKQSFVQRTAAAAKKPAVKAPAPVAAPKPAAKKIAPAADEDRFDNEGGGGSIGSHKWLSRSEAGNQ